MNSLNIDVSLAAKAKFSELLIELHDIMTKKWQLLTNNGLNCFNEVSNSFQKLYGDDEMGDNKSSFNDLQAINNEFESLRKILDSFKLLTEKMKFIETRLFTIFDYDFIKDDENFIDKNFFTVLINVFIKEFKFKELLINSFLYKMRSSREELVSITCYWIHEPHLDQMLISRLKFLVNYFQNK